MSHLRVELHCVLQRRVDGQWTSDLRRFCIGCWRRLGRVWGRGVRCAACGRRVCKACRRVNFMCVLCSQDRFSGKQLWKNETSDKTHALEKQFLPRVRPLQMTLQGWRCQSEVLSHPPSDEGLEEPHLPWWKRQKWRPATSPAYQYTSTTLKQKRRELREQKLKKRGGSLHFNASEKVLFWPEAAFLQRNQVLVRYSLRDFRTMTSPPLDVTQCISLPDRLQHLEQDPDDVWRFLQTRVRRLEEDLSSPPWSNHQDWDLHQSACSSLDWGRMGPEDYRIAYLSSVESSLDYIEDSINAIGHEARYQGGMNTLDVSKRVEFSVDDDSYRDTFDIRETNRDLTLFDFKNMEFKEGNILYADIRILDSDAVSSMDAIENNKDDGKINTLDVREDRTDLINNRDDWDLSLSSEEYKSSTSSDNEFEYISMPTDDCNDSRITTNNTLLSPNSHGWIDKLDAASREENPFITYLPERSNAYADGMKHTEKRHDTNRNSSSQEPNPNIIVSPQSVKSNAKTARRISTIDQLITAKYTKPHIQLFDDLIKSLSYEPLSTNFAEIYAISCDTFATGTSSDEDSIQTQQTTLKLNPLQHFKANEFSHKMFSSMDKTPVSNSILPPGDFCINSWENKENDKQHHTFLSLEQNQKIEKNSFSDRYFRKFLENKIYKIENLSLKNNFELCEQNFKSNINFYDTNLLYFVPMWELNYIKNKNVSIFKDRFRNDIDSLPFFLKTAMLHLPLALPSISTNKFDDLFQNDKIKNILSLPHTKKFKHREFTPLVYYIQKMKLPRAKIFQIRSPIQNRNCDEIENPQREPSESGGLMTSRTSLATFVECLVPRLQVTVPAVLLSQSRSFFRPDVVRSPTVKDALVDHSWRLIDSNHALLDYVVFESDYCAHAPPGLTIAVTMATSPNQNPHKAVRSHGKHISKLMKFFDSSANENVSAEVDIVKEGVREIPSTCASNEANSNHQAISDVVTLLEAAPKSTSSIPFCRKALQTSNTGGLWENVNIKRLSTGDGLWNTMQVDDQHNPAGRFCASTSELNNLIATSRADLSRNSEPHISDKSNLENYFTSFENSKINDLGVYMYNDSSIFCGQLTSSYDCDTTQMCFDDEEGILSDASSDEELKGHPALSNTNYLPAYALHTIIEESCEESERDSRTVTPTIGPGSSKLERYFSWDMINEADSVRLNNKQDDDSTVYSDSLSESSGSPVATDFKDMDPSQLASSRLEKYFTSGLVDNENYFYPEDAKFVENDSVSDFEEDGIHQKISRSALLSSLENSPGSESKFEIRSNTIVSLEKNSPLEIECVTSNENDVAKQENGCDKDCLIDTSTKNTELSLCSNLSLIGKNSNTENKSDSSLLQIEQSIQSLSEIQDANNPVTVSDAVKNGTIKQKSVLSKDQLSANIQAIIRKLISYFSGAEPFQKNFETDYSSAWQLLENEIECLLQSIPSNILDPNSCNSSNNSDYGSDTVESADCMTDEDEGVEHRPRITNKFLFSNIVNSAVNPSYLTDIDSFNISDETLSIWKRLIQSLQRDNSCLSGNNNSDPNAEARLFIKDQIVTLMHTVTVNDNLNDIDKEVLDKQEILYATTASDQINEAYNEGVNTSFNNSIMKEESNFSIKTAFCDDVKNVCDIPLSSLETEILLCDNLPESFELQENQYQDESLFAVALKPPTSFDTNLDMQESSELSQTAKSDYDNCSINLKTKSSIPDNELSLRDNVIKFDVIVDIELDDIKKNNISQSTTSQDVQNSAATKILTIQSFSISDKTPKNDSSPLTEQCPPMSSKNLSVEPKCSRDTGYFSFKSSDDSLLNTSSQSAEVMDVPNFKSLKRTIKKFPLPSATLSKSTNNIFQNFSSTDAKFSTLQFKNKKPKVSNNSSSASKHFSSLFSPSAMFRKLTGSKGADVPPPESAIPAKYLKKYAPSPSVDDESLFGAVSMPHLNTLRPGDSYSELGLYSEPSQDILDQDIDRKRYFSGSQSVLSLGSHSASLTSVYGACYGTVNVSGDVLFGLNYNHKARRMEVFVKQCRHLAAADGKRNKSNPYVKVYLLPDKTRSGKRKTKTKKNTLDPVFNELLRFPVSESELECRTLWLSVWNSDLFAHNDFLGEVSLSLGADLLTSPTLRWYPLQERAECIPRPMQSRGELFLALKFVPRGDLSLDRPSPFAPSCAKGALHVLLKEAVTLSTVDAFCKSYLLPDRSKGSKQKTCVVRRSGHPKWYHTAVYEQTSLEELRERSLELTLWQHEPLAGNTFLGAARLNLATGLYHGLTVDWMDSCREERTLWENMLDSPNMWVDGCLPLRPHINHT